MSTAIAPLTVLPAEATTATLGFARSRRVMFDVTRLLAAYAIVWLHTPRSSALVSSKDLGRFAVPFFVCATIFFIWQALVEKPARGFASYAASRFTRIYVPFLAWSVVYLVFKAAKAWALPDQPNDFPGLEFLWLGSFYHLWFMPFIFVVSLVVFLLGRAAIEKGSVEIAVAISATVIGGFVVMAKAPAAVADTGLVLAWNALPAVLWGVAFAIAYHRGAKRFLETGIAASLALAAGVLYMSWVWQFGRDNLAENLAGLVVTVVALAPWSTRPLVWLGQFGPLAYGIYLSHLLFIKSAEAAQTRLGVDNSWIVDLLVFAFAAIGSTALAWCLSRSSKTRWLAA